MLNSIKKYFSITQDLDSFDNINDLVNQGVRFRGANLIVLVFAIFIASLGLNINSTAVVIGAMLISPLMGPIIGIGFGASTYKVELIKNAVKNYLFATLISLITSIIYFLLSPIDDAQTELLARTTPNIYDVLIAYFGGFAGITAITTKNKGNILPGVAIATALMPPLCTAGYGIATWQLTYSLGALYLFFINTVFIILAVFLYMKFINYPLEEIKKSKSVVRTNRIIFWVSVITIIPSIYLGYDLVNKNQFNRNANKYVNNEFNFTNTIVLKKTIKYSNNKIQIFLAGAKLDSLLLGELIQKKNNYNLTNTKIEINQGATFEKINSNDNINEQFILEKTNHILSGIIDSLREKQENYTDIAKELKYIDENIDTGYIINNNLFTSNQHYQIITVILNQVQSKRINKKSIDSVKVANWLKVRLPNDSVQIKFIK